ncbi:hypothetical protein H5J25_13785 [Sphingomonas aliaeris]|uniref:Uncharacterized protein n=1 Tax=Sphingomonas aliaeris TaxID=2759526 RepID=A0A974NT97_9SPHN|nr:hypothetical protein H5J25_13785 [Sphingomonas aliaeris]
MTSKETQAQRIARARQALADFAAANPGAVDRVNLRLSRIDAARKRERDRFETRVLGRLPEPPVFKKPKGMTASVWRREQAKLIAEAQAAQSLSVKWAHKQGTPETLEHASNTHEGALAQLCANGTINAEQLEWTAQIANVHRSIASDVVVKVASFEARVDQSTRGGDVGERIHRVRMHHAYGIWREMLPAPKTLVLDMIVGDAIGYTVAAVRHRVHNRKAKRLLLEAIARWPMSVAAAFSAIDQGMVDAMNRLDEAPVRLTPHPFGNDSEPSYDQSRAQEFGREATDEPYLLPAIDADFLDEKGHLKPWADIARIVREKVAALSE